MDANERIRALEVRAEESEKRLNERWVAQQAALSKATVELSAKLAVLNDLRNGVISREEYEAKHSEIDQLRVRHDDTFQRLERELAEIRTELVAAPQRRALTRLTVTIAAITAISGVAFVLASILSHGFR